MTNIFNTAKEIKMKGRHSQKVRKIRLADQHRSNVYMSLWNRFTPIPDKMKLTSGDWISIQNFKVGL